MPAATFTASRALISPQIDSIEANTALTVIGEIGLDMSRWPQKNTSALGSVWLQGARSPVANGSVAAPNLGQPSRRCPASGSAVPQPKSVCPGAYFRRLKARLGAPKALTAAAYKLARILYRMLKYGAGYVDQGEAVYEERYRDRLLRNLKRRAAELGFQLTAISSSTGQPALT